MASPPMTGCRHGTATVAGHEARAFSRPEPDCPYGERPTRLMRKETAKPFEQILLVDDDAAIHELVGLALEDEGIDIISASTIAEAERALETHDVALALVDLRLRGTDGMELVRKLAGRPDVGIMIVSGKCDPLDRVIGIEVGADDYVTKPFDTRELVARIKRRLARMRELRGSLSARRKMEPIRVGSWTVDPERHAVLSPDGSPADLSESEFRTIACLARNRGKVLSRDELYAYVVGPGERDPLDRRIDVYVSSLRKKLSLNGPDGIRTVHRVGYIID